MARRYKKVEAGHGHHGGAWKVAYADFVTAMMALFMVMWLLASTDASSRKEISNYFRTGILPEGDLAMNHAAQLRPSVIEEASSPPPPNEQATMETSQTAAKSLADKLGRLAVMDSSLADIIRNVKITVTPEGVLVETVDADKGLLFDLASSKLTERMKKFLKAFAPMLVKMGRPIEINGHTDARKFPAGSKLNNWRLSYERADAAREIIIAAGVPPEQINGLFARGSTQLYVADKPLDSQNRRLSFLLRVSTPVPPMKLEDLEGPTAQPTAVPIVTPPATGEEKPGAEPAKGEEKPGAEPAKGEEKPAVEPAKGEVKPAAETARPAAEAAKPAVEAAKPDEHASPSPAAAAKPADTSHAAPASH